MTRLWQTVRYTGSTNCGALLRTVETVTAIGRKKLVSSLGSNVSSAQLVRRRKIQENTPSMELCRECFIIYISFWYGNMFISSHCSVFVQL